MLYDFPPKKITIWSSAQEYLNIVSSGVDHVFKNNSRRQVFGNHTVC